MEEQVQGLVANAALDQDQKENTLTDLSTRFATFQEDVEKSLEPLFATCVLKEVFVPLSDKVHGLVKDFTTLVEDVRRTRAAAGLPGALPA